MTAQTTNRLIRGGATAGIVGPVLFAVLVVIASFFFDGYSHLHDKISELAGAEAQSPWIQTLNFVMLAISVMWFAWALARQIGRPWLGAALLGFFGFSSALLNAVFPCDADCAPVTTTGLLHIITGLAGFVAAIAGMVLLARRWRNDSQWASHVPFTRAAIGLATAGLIWFVAMQASGATQLNGLAQRTFVVGLLGWILMTSIKLRRITVRGTELAPETRRPVTTGS